MGKERMAKPVLYTVGHSTHPIDYFLELLKHYNVNCVVDVRSLAASRFNPQYNKKSLTTSLNDHHIVYLHLGDEFGARQTDPNVLDNEGRVDFEKIRSTDKFRQGIQQIWSGVEKGYTIALMCSESDPLHCHRFIMISPALGDFEIRHILKDKSIVSQHQLENEIKELYKQRQKKPDLFEVANSEDELMAAYKMLNREVAFSPAQSNRRSNR